MDCSRQNRAHQRGGHHTQAERGGVCDCPNRRLKLTLPIHKEHAPPHKRGSVQQGLSAAREAHAQFARCFVADKRGSLGYTWPTSASSLHSSVASLLSTWHPQLHQPPGKALVKPLPGRPLAKSSASSIELPLFSSPPSHSHWSCTALAPLSPATWLLCSGLYPAPLPFWWYFCSALSFLQQGRLFRLYRSCAHWPFFAMLQQAVLSGSWRAPHCYGLACHRHSSFAPSKCHLTIKDRSRGTAI